MAIKDNKIRIYTFKFLSYILIAIILLVMQTTPNFLEISGIKPLLLAPLLLAVAMLEGEFIGGLFGAFAGVLADYASHTFFGFNSIVFLTAAVTVGLLTTYYIHNKPLNCAIFTLSVLLVRGLIEYYFFYDMWIDYGSVVILINEIIPTAIYTALFAVPIYLPIRYLNNYFQFKIEDN